jgi:hypothetical protein
VGNRNCEKTDAATKESVFGKVPEERLKRVATQGSCSQGSCYCGATTMFALAKTAPAKITAARITLERIIVANLISLPLDRKPKVDRSSLEQKTHHSKHNADVAQPS